jgi:hypothetical protein
MRCSPRRRDGRLPGADGADRRITFALVPLDDRGVIPRSRFFALALDSIGIRSWHEGHFPSALAQPFPQGSSCTFSAVRRNRLRSQLTSPAFAQWSPGAGQWGGRSDLRADDVN